MKHVLFQVVAVIIVFVYSANILAQAVPVQKGQPSPDKGFWLDRKSLEEIVFKLETCEADSLLSCRQKCEQDMLELRGQLAFSETEREHFQKLSEARRLQIMEVEAHLLAATSKHEDQLAETKSTSYLLGTITGAVAVGLTWFVYSQIK